MLSRAKIMLNVFYFIDSKVDQIIGDVEDVGAWASMFDMSDTNCFAL